MVALVFFYLTQVYPLPEIDPRLHPPQDAISGLRGANAVGSVINCHGNPAFVVELFSRENSEVCTTQPGQELETMVCFFSCCCCFPRINLRLLTLCFLIQLLWTRVSKGFKKLNSNEAFINSFDYSLISSPTFLPLHSVVSTYRHSFIYLIHSFIYSYRHWPITHSRSLALSLIHSFIHSFI